MPIRVEQLAAHLERGLSPVYLLGGSESLLLQECRDQVRRAAARAGYEERELMEVGKGFDWEELAAVGAAPSLFAQRRIIDLRLPTGKPGTVGARTLQQWAEAPDPDILLIISCETWDAASRKAKWATALDRAGTRVDIWPVGASELPRWINGRMRAAGLQPDREAVMVLADRAEGNLLAAQQEIDKLVLLRGGGPVSAEDVLGSVADSSRFDAFQLAERMLAGQLGEALRVVAGLRRCGEELPPITGALVQQLRVLEQFVSAVQSGQSEADAFRSLRVWQSRQGAIRAAARRLNRRRLAEAYRRLARLDRQSKGQDRGDPWQELDHLVVSFCA